jgi:hypothetical protein
VVTPPGQIVPLQEEKEKEGNSRIILVLVFMVKKKTLIFTSQAMLWRVRQPEI